MDAVRAAPDRNPPDSVVFLAGGGQPGAVHHVGGDLRPFAVGQQPVARGGAHHAVPHGPGEPGVAQHGDRQVQQARQPPEVPPAAGAPWWFQLSRGPPSRDDARARVVISPSGAVHVPDQARHVTVAGADLRDHRSPSPPGCAGAGSAHLAGLPGRPAAGCGVASPRWQRKARLPACRVTTLPSGAGPCAPSR